MASNLLRSRWAEGATIANAWLTLAQPLAVEVVARAGFPSMTLDLQHGLFDGTTAMNALAACDPNEVTVLARLPWNDPALAMRLLDGGAQGLICPLVNTAADAASFVGACRYPPSGYRSYGPFRARVALGDDYFSAADDHAVTFAMIETADGLANVEAIAAVAGLDGLFVGPSDLSLALGLPLPVAWSSPALQKALQRIVAAAQANGIVAGIYAGSIEQYAPLSAMGFRLITTFNDAEALGKAARAARP